jgi:hypothetical protein
MRCAAIHMLIIASLGFACGRANQPAVADSGSVETAVDGGGLIADAGQDAGPEADGGVDSGSADAAVPTTIIHTDAGVDILLYDYGTPTDCGGIIPEPEDFHPVSMTLPSDAGSCAPPMTDESGIIALGAGGVPPIGRYLLVANDSDGGVIGAFAPGIPFQRLHAGPIGFSAAVEDNISPDGTFEPGDAGWTFFAYDRSGALFSTARRELTNIDSSAIADLPDGGHALVVGDAAKGSFTLQVFNPDSSWQLTAPVVIDAADGGMPILHAVADQEGHLLVQFGWLFDQVACANRWYDIVGQRFGDCLEVYEWPLGHIRTLLGSVSFEQDMDEPPDFFAFLPDPKATPVPPPDMFRQWAIVRNSTAYANWGERCIGDFCSFAPGSMDLLSRSGTKCATLFFRDTNIFVGRDGTVIEQSSCSYRWFPRLLR